MATSVQVGYRGYAYTYHDSQLAITSLCHGSAPDSDFSGFYVGWTTANSTSHTVCTITDELRRELPYNQVPTANLPANAALPEDSESSLLLTRYMRHTFNQSTADFVSRQW